MRYLHELLQFLTAAFVNVFTNCGDVFASFLYGVDRFGHVVGFQAIAYHATENQVLEIAPLFSLRRGDQMIFCSHHESVIVSRKVHATVDAATLVALK